MTGHTLIVSTCGTSLLTNGRSDQDRQLINRYSNERKPEALPADVRTRLDTIFESQQALLRIPRLPVRLVATETVREHLHTIRRLSLGLPVAETELGKLPETLLMRVNGDVALSPWGEVIWGQERKTVYGEKLRPSPDERLVFGPQFERSVRDLPPDRLALVNERIDDLARYLVAGHNRKALDVKPLQGNPRPPSTHECNAWSDRDARRIFVHYEGAKLVLDALDRGLH